MSDKKKKVISMENLQTKPPLLWTLVAFLCMDYWNLYNSAWEGVFYVWLILLWLVHIVSSINTEKVDIFNDK